MFQWLKLSLSGKKILAKSILDYYNLKSPKDTTLFLHSIIQMDCLLQCFLLNCLKEFFLNY